MVYFCCALAERQSPSDASDAERPQFSVFLKVGLLEDMLCLFDTEQHVFYTLVTLGERVCGHPRITHGGAPAAHLKALAALQLNLPARLNLEAPQG